MVLVFELILNFLLIQYIREQAASMAKFQDRNDNVISDGMETGKRNFFGNASPVFVKLKNCFCSKSTMNKSQDNTKKASAIQVSEITNDSRNSDRIEKALAVTVDVLEMQTASHQYEKTQDKLADDVQEISSNVGAMQIPTQDGQQLPHDLSENGIHVATNKSNCNYYDAKSNSEPATPQHVPEVVFGNTLTVIEDNEHRYCEKSMAAKMKSKLRLIKDKYCGVTSSDNQTSTATPTIQTTPTTHFRSYVYQEKATKTVLAISFVQIITTFPFIAAFGKTVYILATDQFEAKIDDVYFTMSWLRVPIVLNSIFNATVYIGRNRKIITFYKNIASNVC